MAVDPVILEEREPTVKAAASGNGRSLLPTCRVLVAVWLSLVRVERRPPCCWITAGGTSVLMTQFEPGGGHWVLGENTTSAHPAVSRGTDVGLATGGQDPHDLGVNFFCAQVWKKE